MKLNPVRTDFSGVNASKNLASKQLSLSSGLLNQIIEQDTKNKLLQQEAINKGISNLALMEQNNLAKEKFLFDKRADEREKQRKIADGIAFNEAIKSARDKTLFTMLPENLERLQNEEVYRNASLENQGKIINSVIQKGLNDKTPYKTDPILLRSLMENNLRKKGLFNEDTPEYLDNLFNREYNVLPQEYVTSMMQDPSSALKGVFKDSGGTTGKSVKNTDKNVRDNILFMDAQYDNMGIRKGEQGEWSELFDNWLWDKPDAYRADADFLRKALEMKGIRTPYALGAIKSILDGDEWNVDVKEALENSDSKEYKDLMSDLYTTAIGLQKGQEGGTTLGSNTAINTDTVNAIFSNANNYNRNLLRQSRPRAFTPEERYAYYYEEILDKYRTKPDVNNTQNSNEIVLGGKKFKIDEDKGELKPKQKEPVYKKEPKFEESERENIPAENAKLFGLDTSISDEEYLSGTPTDKLFIDRFKASNNLSENEKELAEYGTDKEIGDYLLSTSSTGNTKYTGFESEDTLKRLNRNRHAKDLKRNTSIRKYGNLLDNERLFTQEEKSKMVDNPVFFKDRSTYMTNEEANRMEELEYLLKNKDLMSTLGLNPTKVGQDRLDLLRTINSRKGSEITAEHLEKAKTQKNKTLKEIEKKIKTDYQRKVFNQLQDPNLSPVKRQQLLIALKRNLGMSN